MHMTYKQYFYKNKEKEIDGLFLEYHVPVVFCFSILHLFKNKDKTLMLLLIKNIYIQRCKFTINYEKIDRNAKTEYWQKRKVSNGTFS